MDTQVIQGQQDQFVQEQKQNVQLNGQSSKCWELKVYGNHLGNCKLCVYINQWEQYEEKLKEQQENDAIAAEKEQKKQEQKENQDYTIDQLVEIEDNLDKQFIQKKFFEDDIINLIEQFQNCECCQGLVYQCKGKACKILGECYCYYNWQQNQDKDQQQQEENKQKNDDQEEQEEVYEVDENDEYEAENSEKEQQEQENQEDLGNAFLNSLTNQQNEPQN